MKRRIKLNNKKSHFPLPLGEGRISTQGTSVRNSGEGKSFTKALSVAALAGLTFFGAQANAQEVNADDNSSLTFEEGQITGAAAEIAPTLGDNSALSFTQENADANNYNFTDTDENGNIRYWLIKLDNDKISNTDHISWEEVDNLQENTIQVNLPNNKSKFYKYTILDTTGDYIGYTNTSSGNARGGAIYNPSNNKIQANFINNSAIATTYAAQGGAIANYNNSSVKEIAGTFIQNGTSAGLNSNGGAIWINDSIVHDKISGAFIGNYNTTTSTQAGSEGGAIAIHGSFVKNIEGNFIGNYQSAQYRDGGGAGLRYYYGSSDSIKSDFIGNHIEVATQAYGGALAVGYSNIKELTGDFVCNSAVGGYSDGGAIIIYGNSGQNAEIKNIKGSFIGNYAIGNSSYAYGGAIRLKNNGNIESLKGNFLGNYAIGKTEAQGGAISNSSATITAINDAVFIGNYALATGANGYAHGGAIYNTGTIGEISKSSFNNNYAKSEKGAAYGGAIYNTGTVNGGTIGEISGNYAEAGANYAYGGAIYNTSNTFKLDEIGDITGNHATSTTAPAQGGAIYNTAAADFGKLNGAIKNNYVLSGKLDENGKVISGTGSVAYGGAIYNTAGGFTGGNVTEISGNYAESGSAPAYGGAIYNTSNAFKLDEIGDIINNHVYSPYAPAEGGAIYNENGNLGTLNGAIKDNYAISGTSGTYDENGNLVSGAYAYGGAIYNANNGIVTGGTITEISGNYVEGYSGAQGGAIWNVSNTFKLDEVGDITDNHAIAAVAPAYGGAIYNEKGNLGKLNGAIKDNYAVSMRYDSNGEPIGGYGAMGGAIYNINNGTVTGGDITEISGNYVEAYGQSNVDGYYPYARGGAIYNTSSNFKLDSISNITDNHAESTHCAYIDGGAIYNEKGNLGEINGVIKNNYLINHDQQTVSDMSGGAIYNYNGTATGGNITEISGNYITSYLAYFSCGGAIYNTSAKFKLDGIANIINNHIEQKSEGYLGGHQEGGAIYNSRGNLGTINGVIKDNYIIGSVAYGGAIYNYNGTVTGGDITEISGNYIKSYGYAEGGAIYNWSSNFKLDSIGDITNNHIESGNVGSAASGGAIYNSGGNLGVINGVIKNNYVKNETYQALGGAIYNTSGGFTGGVITEISNNYVEGTNYASGGAIYNTSSTFKLDGIGDIINNHAGAINPDYYTAAQGGAIYNSGGNLGEINGVIKNNYVLGNSSGQGSYTYGGAIYNANNGIVTGGTIAGISDNYAKGGFASGGAIYNSATFSANIIGDVVNNYTEGAIGLSGGAIYNSGTFGNIVSENISNNYAKYKYSNSQGGAIDNEGNGTIASLYVKNLTDNYIMLSDKTYGAYEYGGAIYNAGTIKEGFIENVSDNYIDGRYASGGAICNTGAFNAAIGNIVNNYAKSTAAPTYGGAIYNSGTMTTLTGDNLSNNYATSETAPVYGGAIYNSGNNAKIDTISYNKIENNYASGKYNAYGGALYNTGKIENLSANSLKNNHVTEENYSTYGSNRGAYGGAIYNTGTINSGAITEISGNYVEGTDNAQGGAIYNTSTTFKLDEIGDITGNHATSTTAPAQGGAIYNTGGVLGELNGAIKDNYAASSGNVALGGAIYNISGGFTGGNVTEISGNYTESGNAPAYGGAIYNISTTFKLDAITGSIKDNHAKSENNYAYGGAIYNGGGTIEQIKTSEISGNYAEALYTGPSNGGGAIFNGGTIGEFSTNNLSNNHMLIGELDENGNFVSGGGVAYGGALHNTGTINGGTIGNIKDNYAQGYNGAMGGAIYNTSANFKLDTINGDISGNHAKSNPNVNGNPVGGGAIYTTGGEIGEISTNKISNNYAEGYMALGGGAIYNTAKIGNITANEISNNHAKATGTLPNTNGGAISNSGTAGNITANEIKGNYVQSPTYSSNGGAISNSGTMGDVKANMIGNYVEATPTTVNPAYASGGALSNTGTMGKVTGTYKDNYVKTENGNPASQASFARGGALYNKGTINGGIVNSSFLSNYAEAKDGTAQGGAVWTSKDLDITANNGTSVFKGNYTKTDGEKDDNAIYVASADAKLNLKQLNNGNMYMYDNIRGEDGYNVNISGDSTGTYYMFNDIYNGNVTMANTTINTVNNKIHTYDFKSLSVNGNTDFVADVDMANQTMDRFTASAYGNHSGKLNVKDMNFISGSDKNKIEIYFAQKGLKDYVTTSKKEFLTPLYKYGIHYDNRDDAGYFVFTRGAGSSNPSDGFNPAVLTSPVATQAGAQASMTNTLYYAFEHGDTFMNFSAMDRFAKINSNTYALAERQGALSTDFNSNLNLDYVHQNKAVWTKPYSSFESIHLKNGPKVDVISYGTLIGFDSNIHKLKRGWANVATAYIGYNGSQVDYSNVDASTNGGLLGLTETFYKGNFWTALTATAGASFAEAHTMYGKDEMTMLMAGIGSKTGYNFEFKEGKFIIQPRLFMSYSFVNTFDYTNSAGVRIDSDPMHTVQINPSVKFIGNIKGGWQPYASIGMVWNLLNETHTEANGVKLPEMHTKPYVEYGVGLQRTWADKFSAYGQAMLRHGGRNGVALTFGFRWAIGKDKTQKVQKDSKMSGRQEIKRTSKTLSHQNEPATEGNRKVLKQLSQTQKAYLEHTTHTAMNANVEKL